MSRIQKKCFIASTGFHLLLVVLLFVGPAFLSSNSSKPDDSLVLTFVPLITTDEKIAGGGTPNGSPPPPAPAPQQRQQQQAEPPKPAPAPPKIEKTPTSEPEKDDSESLAPATKPKIKPNLKQTVRRTGSSTTRNPTSQPQATDQGSTKNLQAFNSAVKNLRSGLSAGTTVDLPQGPGGGGVPYANFYDGVKKIYSDAWVLPDGVTDDSATVTASVTIARDGEVLDASVVVRSGNAEVDESVAATLRRVRFAVPLPAGAKEDKRTVRIKFNVKAQRLLG